MVKLYYSLFGAFLFLVVILLTVYGIQQLLKVLQIIVLPIPI